MIGHFYLIPCDDPSALRRAADALRDWDPHWDLDVPDRFARLYEPDGTLYAFCRDRPMTLAHNHREHALRAGDLLIVPRELALDLEPEVDLFALRHRGTPPNHFRERFIQVWGFEHVRPEARSRESEGPIAVISREDPRYPVAYWLAEERGADGLRGTTGLEAVLLLAFPGEPCRVRLGASGETCTLDPSDALLIGPGVEYAVSGSARLGIVTLFNELQQECRQATATGAGKYTGPEFDPAERAAR